MMKRIVYCLLIGLVIALGSCKEKDKNTYRVYTSCWQYGYDEINVLHNYLAQYGYDVMDLYTFSAANDEAAARVFSQRASRLQQVDWVSVMKQAQKEGVIRYLPAPGTIQIYFTLYRMDEEGVIYVGNRLAEVVLDI